MSKCVTLADDTLDQQRDISSEITVKDVVEFILEEAIVAAVLFSDKDCSRIGDFNITQDFCQQSDQVPAHSKEFEVIKLNSNQNCSGGTTKLKLESGESIDRSISLLTAKENIEFILDSLTKIEEKIKNPNDCKVISEKIFADNELIIENGKIHFGKNNVHNVPDKNLIRVSHMTKEERTEIGSASSRKLNKIYVPLDSFPSASVIEIKSGKEEETEAKTARSHFENDPNAFASSSTEDLRQVFSEADPNRPRGYAIAEEDVKKVFKEIEEINFTQNNGNTQELTPGKGSDGKGDPGLDISESDEFPSQSSASSISTYNVESRFNEIHDIANQAASSNSNGQENNCIEEERLLAQSDNAQQLLQSTKSFLKVTELNESFDFTGILKEFESGAVISEEPMENMALNHKNSVSKTGNARENISLDIRKNFIYDDKCPHELLQEGHISELLKNCDNNISNEASNCFGTTEVGIENVYVQKLESDTMKNNEISIIDGASKSNAKTFDAENNILETSHSKKKNNTAFLPLSSCKYDLRYDVGVNSALGHLTETEIRNDADHERSCCSTPKGFSIGPKEIEMVLSDSRLSKNNKIIYNDLKGSQSAGDSFPEGLATGVSSQPKTEAFKDGLFFLEKNVEVISVTSYKTESENSNLLELPRIDFSPNAKEKNSAKNKINIKMNSIDCQNCSEETEILNERPEQQMHEEETYKSSLALSVTNTGKKSLTHALDGSGINEGKSEYSVDENNRNLNEKQSRVIPQSCFANLTLNSENKSTKIELEQEYEAGSFPLVNSEEILFGEVEDVIQIIEPTENGNEEDIVSFSLPEKFEPKVNYGIETQPTKTTDLKDAEKKDKFSSSAGSVPNKRIRSGMTTIGPMKNLNHDPKDLTCDVDFGKMTHISSSRKLTKEDLSGSNVISLTSLTSEVESVEDRFQTNGRELVQVGSFVNRDIASLTKVQKIREVMSYHPKPEDDFDDDNNLNRLDLKDVESVMDERYKVQDVNIPLLSFDVRDNDSRSNKDLVQNLRLVLSGNCFANGNFYLANNAGHTTGTEIENGDFSEGSASTNSDHTEIESAERTIAKAVTEDVMVIEANEKASCKTDVFLQSADSNSAEQRRNNTLGSVFRKASNRLIRKDGEFYLRNTKSLPRDAGKLMPTESIKSILEECHSSAANMLKKSRSFLKNTNGLFKTISQSRFGSTNALNHRKFSPSELEMGSSETSTPSFLKKEEMTKSKSILKNKIEKTFKMAENSVRKKFESTADKHSKTSISAGNEEGEQVSEYGEAKEGGNGISNVNLKDFLSKGPLVYKSQFVQNKGNFGGGSSEGIDSNSLRSLSTSNEKLEHDQPVGEKIVLNLEEKFDAKSEFNCEKTMNAFHGKTSGSNSEITDDVEVPDYIVMQTVEGLPVPDLENSCYLVEVEISESPDAVSIENDPLVTLNPMEYKETVKNKEEKVEKNLECEHLNKDSHSEKWLRPPDQDECSPFHNDQLENKAGSKSKKFTSRLRNFWISAFGKVKTSPRKKESS